jgi:hypothetical protein
MADVEPTFLYPTVLDPAKVGTYPASAGGGGYVWDEVLEYRVWCHSDEESDYYYAFATYREALAFSKKTSGAEAPCVLILQREYIDQPSEGHYVHVKKERVAEWSVEFLRRPRRTPQTIPDFLSPDAPANRLEILRGQAVRDRR